MNTQSVRIVVAILVGILGYYELYFDKISISSNSIAGLLLLGVGLIIACTSLSTPEAPK